MRINYAGSFNSHEVFNLMQGFQCREYNDAAGAGRKIGIGKEERIALDFIANPKRKLIRFELLCMWGSIQLLPVAMMVVAVFMCNHEQFHRTGDLFKQEQFMGPRGFEWNEYMCTGDCEREIDAHPVPHKLGFIAQALHDKSLIKSFLIPTGGVKQQSPRERSCNEPAEPKEKCTNGNYALVRQHEIHFCCVSPRSWFDASGDLGV